MIKVLILTLFLTGCSWKDVIGLLSPSSGGIDTEIVVGDKKEEIVTEIGTQKQTANEITNTTVDNAPVWLIVLAMLGWFLPTPQGMVKMYLVVHAFNALSLHARGP